MHNDKQLAQLAEPHHRGEAREIAAIDLGSNSFHMIVARIINGSIQVLSRLKQKVRLADGLDEHNVLSQEAIERGVNCLALFAERLQGFEPKDVNVVGTYTLRSIMTNFYVKLPLSFLIPLISSAVKLKPKPFMRVFATLNPKADVNWSSILVVARPK